ncbi:MAG: hypothetical protein A2992_03745 [Elusimicrobia bacterium RIFCSPLOWO2_01_FULL_59_12]|nr:MAG: hypothetical protein A2992_03745 [Elusimicrobia bacterium RIFCSPLOWO2_01_FULL_59_12]
MASLRDIRRKIKSVKNTQQITKAMNPPSPRASADEDGLSAIARLAFGERRRMAACLEFAIIGIVLVYPRPAYAANEMVAMMLGTPGVIVSLVGVSIFAVCIAWIARRSGIRITWRDLINKWSLLLSVAAVVFFTEYILMSWLFLIPTFIFCSEIVIIISIFTRSLPRSTQ